eukprot:Amastigsp_a342597_31.p6 type:complete len:129 gc:universal Amastigsp_a342597_31:598-212(-)
MHLGLVGSERPRVGSQQRQLPARRPRAQQPGDASPSPRVGHAAASLGVARRHRVCLGRAQGGPCDCCAPPERLGRNPGHRHDSERRSSFLRAPPRRDRCLGVEDGKTAPKSRDRRLVRACERPRPLAQ